MKQLGVLLLPPGWDASPPQGTEHEATTCRSITTHPWMDASPPQGTQHEVTRSITTSPLDGILVHHRIPSMKRLGVLLLSLDGMLFHHSVPCLKRLGEFLVIVENAENQTFRTCSLSQWLKRNSLRKREHPQNSCIPPFFSVKSFA